MATIKAIIRKDKLNAKGEAPLYIRITQNRKTLGYSKAVKIIDQLEAIGIIEFVNGGKSSKVLLPNQQALDLHLSRLKLK